MSAVEDALAALRPVYAEVAPRVKRVIEGEIRYFQPGRPRPTSTRIFYVSSF